MNKTPQNQKQPQKLKKLCGQNKVNRTQGTSSQMPRYNCCDMSYAKPIFMSHFVTDPTLIHHSFTYIYIHI